jgi:hypothetical protein
MELPFKQVSWITRQHVCYKEILHIMIIVSFIVHDSWKLVAIVWDSTRGFAYVQLQCEAFSNDLSHTLARPSKDTSSNASCEGLCEPQWVKLLKLLLHTRSAPFCCMSMFLDCDLVKWTCQDTMPSHSPSFSCSWYSPARKHFIAFQSHRRT